MKQMYSILAGKLAALMLALLVFPVSLLAVDQPIVGIAGPAINMIYSFVARDAGLFRSMASIPSWLSSTPAPCWPKLPWRVTLRSP